VDAAPVAGLHAALRYTLLDGRILESGAALDPVFAAGQPLLRRPRHEASLSCRGERGRFGAGATLVLVGSRSDSDFLGLGLRENPGYVRLDARARAAIGHGFEAFVVADNLFDRRYQASLGYPAAGRLVRVGLRFRSEPRP
jgi:outer membrane receptor protein involved in Fe transport